MSGKYPWPASALGEAEMSILHDLREKTKIPICRVLQNIINEKAEEASE